MSKMLIVSPEFNCSQEVLTIVAMLSGRLVFAPLSIGLTIPPAVPNIWLRPNNQRKEADAAKQLLTVPDGDHLTLLNVFNEYQNSTCHTNLFLPLPTTMLSHRPTRPRLGMEQLHFGPLTRPSRQRPRLAATSYGAPRNRSCNQVIQRSDAALHGHSKGTGVRILYAGCTQGR